MREKAPAGRRSGCPINILLEAVGDTWSLLIVRDLMFFGRKTYNEFPNAGEKIATNILSDRLQRLESSGIVAKQRDPSDARRYLYRLTEKGTDLAPVGVIREMTENREGFIAKVRERWMHGSPP